MSNCCEARVKSITKPLFALYEKYLTDVKLFGYEFLGIPPTHTSS